MWIRHNLKVTGDVINYDDTDKSHAPLTYKLQSTHNSCHRPRRVCTDENRCRIKAKGFVKGRRVRWAAGTNMRNKGPYNNTCLTWVFARFPASRRRAVADVLSARLRGPRKTCEGRGCAVKSSTNYVPVRSRLGGGSLTARDAVSGGEPSYTYLFCRQTVRAPRPRLPVRSIPRS